LWARAANASGRTQPRAVSCRKPTFNANRAPSQQKNNTFIKKSRHDHKTARLSTKRLANGAKKCTVIQVQKQFAIERFYKTGVSFTLFTN
jgi:hypothetical protein